MPANAPVFFEFPARGIVQFSFIVAEHHGVDAAYGADSMIAAEYRFAQVAGVGAQLPFMHADRVAKREAAGGHFAAAPSAGASLPLDPSAGFDTLPAHTRNSRSEERRVG